MAEAFNPYHRWLGIPIEEQPANHYRLLGLARFEADLEVIRDGAERQVAHVRRYALGPNAATSQRLLNELARAKSCLLDPEKKGQYDEQLRAASVPTAPVAVATQPVAAAPPSPPPIEPAPLAAIVPPPGVRSPPPATIAVIVPEADTEPMPVAPGMPWAIMLAAGLSVGIVCVAGAWIVFQNQAHSPTVATAARQEAPAPPVAARSADGPGNARTTATIAPKLLAQSPRTATVGLHMSMPMSLAEPNASPIVYRLRNSPPEAMRIDPQTGVISWTPTRADADRVHQFEVEAVVSGNEQLADRTTVSIEVPALRPPVVTMPYSSPLVTAGQMTTVRLDARDPQYPPQKVVYSLVAAPAWVKIDQGSGLITCQPSVETGDQTVPVKVRVAFENQASLFNEKELTIVVREPPTPATFVVTLPSGRRFDTSEIPSTAQADMERRSLLGRGYNDVAAFVVDPDKGLVTFICGRKSLEPQGSALVYYDNFQVNQFANYRSGKLNGTVTHWSREGRCDFFGHYFAGSRSGICCLLENERPSVIMECDAGKIMTVHILRGMRFVKSFGSVEEAGADPVAAAKIKECNDLDLAIKQVDREMRDRIAKAMNAQRGAMSAENRAINRARSAARQAEDRAKGDGVIRAMQGK